MSMWDDEAGYDYDDPKHPTYRERYADAADAARKAAKENPPDTPRERAEANYEADRKLLIGIIESNDPEQLAQAADAVRIAIENAAIIPRQGNTNAPRAELNGEP